MVESRINELLTFWDKYFIKEKIEIDNRGCCGAHYDGLSLDTYISDSIYDIDYLSIEDYFMTEANVPYNERISLSAQYGKLDLNAKIKVIQCVLNLLSVSSYNKERNEYIVNKSKTFLQRYGLEIIEEAGKIVISDRYQIASGTYCNIYFYNSQYYMKQLKTHFAADDSWVKRFKYEYENMEKLIDSPYVLKVFSFDEDNNSYLMEKCDCDIDDYLKASPFISDEQIINLIYELLDGMIDVHNAGIIHRDLHLGNILMKEGHIVLSDFGLSKDTMLSHSLKSTSTPKNSHFFMDPVGLVDFTKLDKLSDIYSVGKIIDYLTKNSNLNEALSFCINKATDRDRTRRYRALEELKKDIQLIQQDMDAEEKNKATMEKIRKNINAPDVEEKICTLISKDELSNFIIEHSLLNFDKLLLQLSISVQYDALCEIERNYQQATGYMQFQNYDVFGEIASRYIERSKEIQNQKKAYLILEGCAGYRYNMANELERIQSRYPTITN